MRMIASVLLALALAACATQPEIRGAELDALAEELIQFAADHSDLEPLPPPRVEFVADVGAAFSKKYAADFQTLPIGVEEQGLEVKGGYEYATGVIWLRNDWHPTTFEESVFLHELVHYLQHLQGSPLCRQDLEAEAYDIQRRFLNEKGFGLPDNWAMEFVPAGCE